MKPDKNAPQTPGSLGLLREYYRRHFRAFCAEQLWISPREGGQEIRFVLNDGQRLLDEKIEEQTRRQGYVRGLAHKGRQQGFSTYAQARQFHGAACTRNYSALLIAHDDVATQRIFEKTRMFFECLHPDLRPEMRYSSKRELVFENPSAATRGARPGMRSRIEFQSARNIGAGAGTTRQSLHLSEVARYYPDQIQLLVSSLLPAIHSVPGTFVLQESTAFIGGDHFREACDAARHGKSPYFYCFVPWWLEAANAIALLAGERIVPDAEERSLQRLATRGQPAIGVPPHPITPAQFKWRRARLSEPRLGDLFEQEYPRDPDSAWVNLESSVFDSRVLYAMRDDLREPLRLITVDLAASVRDRGPVLLTHRTGPHLRLFSDLEYIAVFAEPELGCDYDIGADVATGASGGDYSTAIITRRDTHEQVLEYRHRSDPIDFGAELYWIGKAYHTAQIGVEMTGPGYVTGGELGRLGYPNLYRWRHRERDVPTLSQLAGWKMQHDSKKVAVATSRHLINHRQALVRSRVLHEELSNYCHLGADTYGASTGHDDLVIAFLIANQIGADESYGVQATVPAPPTRLTIGERLAQTMPALRDNRDPGNPEPAGDLQMRPGELEGIP